MTTTFRPATPADAAFIGRSQVMAARGHLSRGWFEIVLQRDEDFCIAFAAKLAIAKSVSWWHYSFVTIAEVDGAVAAAACTYPDSAPYMVANAAMTEASDAMGLSKAEQAQLWPRGSFILSATTGEENCWTIENVATKPEFRGRGVAAALIRHMLDDMSESGPKRAQISFLIGNVPAERCYSACGFVFAEDKTAEEFEAAMGVPGLRRMARDL
ncbi:MAG: GNAT family N-acetyltransferase [Proteobacteria bacterium]|nr:GNAT family N-acetyltransferase [Pseudomonadota bacterium]